MNEREKLIYNEGERLIPGISHSVAEKIRHYSSYNFFVTQIWEQQRFRSDVPSILDLGCGVGYGCELLAELPHVNVTGVDCSSDVIAYANDFHSCGRIQYMTSDLNYFIPNMPAYDYVVSRGVFEHIENAFELIKQVKFNRLFMFDVPYNEKPGNPHHKILGILEKDFESLSNYELWYEDLAGNISKEKSSTVNMVMCICRK